MTGSSTSTLSDHQQYDSLVKLIIIGDSAVGKSCLLLRFCDDEFTPSFISTIGLDYKSKTVILDDSEYNEAQKQKVKIQIWDTAGQEQFKTMTSSFYRSAMGVLLVYDVTYERSFRNIQNWLDIVKENAPEGIEKCLVGSKCDMEGKRQVSYAEGAQFAKENGMSFFETSSKSNINVEDTFINLTRKCLTKLPKNSRKKSATAAQRIKLENGDYYTSSNNQNNNSSKTYAGKLASKFGNCCI